MSIITKEDMALVEDNCLSTKQLQFLFKETPEKFKQKRPAKGGGTWDYVSVGYVQKALNLMFGFDWDFEVLGEEVYDTEVVVKGRLTCRTNGRVIVKTQYGNKDIMFRKGSDKALSIGNDMKAAASDALKKCASLIGIAADVYTPNEFKEVEIVSEEISEEEKRVRTFLNKAKDAMAISAIESQLKKEGLYEQYKDLVEARKEAIGG